MQIDNSFVKLGKFLSENEDVFLDIWEKQIIVHTDEDSIETIKKNGYFMYRIITNSILNNITEDELKGLAYKVAQERTDANINIGEFVYNVNIGRSIIIKYVNQSGIPLEELQPIIDLINRQFDLFCYYAVSRYTELKDKKIQEKTLFITQTHKDRLAILGQMSSSFVHEFRNPLTSIMGFISLLKNEYPSLPYLNIISSELDQLNFRITQFLHTSKMKLVSDSKEEVIPVKILLDEVVDFLYPSLVDGNIEVITNIDEHAKVKGDRNELKQVVLNLLMNAVDAVYEEVNKRKIIIHSKVDNEQITIKVSNNGPAINPEAAKIIFEPFYTTKKLGTGIGLYVCKKIVEKNNGTIQCTSKDELTTFEIKLPSFQM
ncbi:ATP-binding protein [Caldibacillus lycopersici]|uniref:histidine kinase n=1 Tax=Perspicuibacillus lycopersici TaxID=1325689 RepID=A0AAE3IUV2_9BACI|nr:histidine kinase N-terminal domain-containing protein [Perspicuibacillus lycopersici]MCU9614872.1 ATP-binding protein [Perspicuibacillus lycopersici]